MAPPGSRGASRMSFFRRPMIPRSCLPTVAWAGFSIAHGLTLTSRPRPRPRALRCWSAPRRPAWGAMETTVGTCACLDTRVPSRDMESCAQYVLQGIEFNPNAFYLQFSNAIAPGGYAWIFPKAVGVANVGLGIVSLRADGRNARQYLDDWIGRRFPAGARTGYTVGGVIVHTTIKKTYADGVLVAGDAAHMLNPLSGGGINNAMKAGRLAGCTAAAAVREHDTSEGRLASYHKAWMDLLGEDHLKYYRLKQALEHMDDAFLNALARTVNKIPSDKRTLGRVLMKAIVKHPQLIPVVAGFFV